MKLIDFDGLFDEKLAVYMEENKNKYTERQWEDVIPRLYQRFGDTYVAKIKCTPKEYYAKMSNTELAGTLEQHLKQDVPVPEFLCEEMERRGEAQTLLPLLQSDDCATVLYAINMLGDNPAAFDAYFDILLKNRFNEEVRSDVCDVLRLHADVVKDRALAAYNQGAAREYMLEILSRVKNKSEEVYNVLAQAFSQGNTALCAGYLASYGDERALPLLLDKIESAEIGFVEFQELKYAIEALGGEYKKERDFSADKDYIVVETMSAKFAEELKS